MKRWIALLLLLLAPVVASAQRIADSGDVPPTQPPTGVMTEAEMREYIVKLMAHVQVLSEALNKCSQQYLPRIMDENNANWALFGQVQCVEHVISFVQNQMPDECHGIMVYDELVSMKLEELFPPEDTGIDIIWENGDDS
jgi:hypothetical protein